MQHPRFGIPRLMLFLIIGNVIVYLFEMMDTTGLLYNALIFNAAAICRGQVWRILTFLIVPQSDSILLLAISLYFYYFIGSILEREWGAGKFTIYYFSGALVAALYALIIYWVFQVNIPITGYYLNMSLFFAFATLWPEQRVLLFFVIPIKMKWLALADAAYFAYEMVRYCVYAIQTHVYAYFALAGLILVVMIPYFVFCGGWLFDRFTPQARRTKARTINFKQAVHRAEQKKTADDLVRRCAVCGRTAEANPGLEFRYCSRCAGYHCFCADHINNHIHFTE